MSCTQDTSQPRLTIPPAVISVTSAARLVITKGTPLLLVTSSLEYQSRGCSTCVSDFNRVGAVRSSQEAWLGHDEGGRGAALFFKLERFSFSITFVRSFRVSLECRPRPQYFGGVFYIIPVNNHSGIHLNLSITFCANKMKPCT